MTAKSPPDSRNSSESRFARASARGNQILARLPPALRARLTAQLHRVRLVAGQSVFLANEALPAAFFPETAVIALLTHLNDGQTIDVALVGKDGIAGVALLPGVNSMPCDASVEIAGSAWRIDAEELREAVRQMGPLRELLGRYAYSLFAHGVQSAACNNFHSVKKRCARWLLMTHDLVDGDEFHITQDLLATMLGVRRPSVTIAARALRRGGFIDYHHGHMKIRNRRGLEAVSCECYRVMREEQQRLLGY